MSVLPALNFAAREAAISMLSPVLGLRPVRALRVDTEKVPNPEMLTLSPCFSAADDLVEHRVDGPLGDRPRQINLARNGFDQLSFGHPALSVSRRRMTRAL